MTVAVVYIAVTNGPRTSDLCARFVSTWHEFPPEAPCDLFVACNGGPLNSEQAAMLSALKPRLFPRLNDPGHDISAFQDAAYGLCAEYTAMLCLGESIHFHRAGWLRRLVEAWGRWGPGLYGPFASNNVRGHLQTSAFFCAPAHLRSYAARPQTRAQRMEFEHGERAFWRRLARQGLPVRCVTFDGEWPPQHWRYPNNIIGRGDQSNLLCLNNHAEAWQRADPSTRAKWSVQYDQPFR